MRKLVRLVCIVSVLGLASAHAFLVVPDAAKTAEPVAAADGSPCGSGHTKWITAQGPKPFNYHSVIGSAADSTPNKFTAALGATTQKAAMGVSTGVPGGNVLASVLGQTNASAAIGGTMMGADMIQMNMRMNMQFMVLQQRVELESRARTVHQMERCSQRAQDFRVEGVGFDLSEREFVKRHSQAHLEQSISHDEEGTRVYTLTGFKELDHLQVHFWKGVMSKMVVQWKPADLKQHYEAVKTKLQGQLGMDDSYRQVIIPDLAHLQQAFEPSPESKPMSWDFTDVAVDRTFRLSHDEAANTVTLEVTAPSVSIEVGF